MEKTDRQKQIAKAGRQFAKALSTVGEGDAYSFERGAEWADRYPKEEKPLDKNLTAEEIAVLIEDCNCRRRTLLSLLQEKELEGRNYEKQFIEIPHYGRMYVTWQKLDKSDDYFGNIMFFQGIAYYTELSVYQDDSYFSYDAMQEWRIPYEQFKNIEITILTKEEFINGFKKCYDNLFNEFELWTNKLSEK